MPRGDNRPDDLFLKYSSPDSVNLSPGARQGPAEDFSSNLISFKCRHFTSAKKENNPDPEQWTLLPLPLSIFALTTAVYEIPERVAVTRFEARLLRETFRVNGDADYLWPYGMTYSICTLANFASPLPDVAGPYGIQGRNGRPDRMFALSLIRTYTCIESDKDSRCLCTQFASSCHGTGCWTATPSWQSSWASLFVDCRPPMTRSSPRGGPAYKSRAMAKIAIQIYRSQHDGTAAKNLALLHAT